VARREGGNDRSDDDDDDDDDPDRTAERTSFPAPAGVAVCMRCMRVLPTNLSSCATCTPYVPPE
jgi:hypothetical protein